MGSSWFKAAAPELPREGRGAHVLDVMGRLSVVGTGRDRKGVPFQEADRGHLPTRSQKQSQKAKNRLIDEERVDPTCKGVFLYYGGPREVKSTQYVAKRRGRTEPRAKARGLIGEKPDDHVRDNDNNNDNGSGDSDHRNATKKTRQTTPIPTTKARPPPPNKQTNKQKQANYPSRTPASS